MNGVDLKWGTIKEILAFSAWTQKRTLRIHELKAIVCAPRDAATTVSENYEETRDSFEALDRFVETLWPEIAKLKAAQLRHQKAVLAEYRDKPFALVKKQDAEGNMGVDLVPTE